MAKKTLYMHIGIHKTGTSAIQIFLRNNREVFERRRIVIYTADDNISEYNLRYLSAYLNIIEKTELIDQGLLPRNVSLHREILSTWYTNFLSSMRQAEYDNIILSEEMLWLAVCNKEKILQLMGDIQGDFKIKIIVYLRRQDYYIMSIYQQALKVGRCRGMKCSEWINTLPNPHTSLFTYYAENIKWLSGIVGMENIIIRIYEKEQFKDQSIFSDFMNAIDLEVTDDFVLPKDIINPGLTPFAAELARCFSKNNDEEIYFTSFISKYHSKELYNRSFIQHDFLSPSERVCFMEKYETGNKYIAEKLLNRKDGRLFYEPLPDCSASWTPYKLPFEDALSFLLRIINKQNLEIENLKNTIYMKFDKIERLKQFGRKMPPFLQYPARKIWHLGKLIMKKISK